MIIITKTALVLVNDRFDCHQTNGYVLCIHLGAEVAGSV